MRSAKYETKNGEERMVGWQREWLAQYIGQVQ